MAIKQWGATESRQAVFQSDEWTTFPTVLLGNYTKQVANYASFAAAVADLPDAGANGGELVLDGEVPMSSGFSVPAKINLVGRGTGSTALVAPAGVTTPLLDIDGNSDVVLSGFSLLKASGASASSTGYGIRIRGDATDILLDDLFGDEFVSIIHAAGADGTVPGTIRRLSLRNVRSRRSPTLWGMIFDDVDGVNLVDCHSYENWLDGIKFRKKSKNIAILGGSANGNGRSRNPSYGNNPAANGDGIDAYAGGDTFSLVGFTCNGNYGSGAQIKTGPLTETDSADYGFVRNMNITDFVAVGNPVGSGLLINVNDPAILTQPVPANVTINGGLLMENAVNGLYLNARNVAGHGIMAVRNAQAGITINTRSMDVVLNSPMSIASGYPTNNGAHGIVISGTNITLNTPTVIGRDADDITGEADYTGTIYTNHAISVSSVAAGVITINDGKFRHCSQNKVYPTAAIAGDLLVHEAGDISPINRQFGSMGSTWLQTDATGRTVRWTKVGGTSATVAEWAAVMHGVGPFTGTLNFGSIAAGASETLTIGVSVAFGVAATDMALVTPPSTLDAGLIITAWCTANTFNIRLTNVTAGAIDPASGTWAAATLKV